MSCPSCGALYRSGFSCCPSDGAPLVSYEVDPIIGETIADNYVVDDCIGEGGMGRVYRAHHARLERRQFAVKILLGELAASEEMRRRFEQEAQAASRLHHANVVPVLDFGQQGGLLYIVMEFVRGRTLSSIIDEGPMHERRMLEIARKLCLGLAHAHEQGLVHRDFKPENVIIVDADDGEVPRILDFGLAIIADPGESATRLTSAGMIMGTPAYISPEQSSGKDVDHRTDLFALGICMYEMLAGTLPFTGTVMEVLASNAVRQPPPIGERSPGVTVSPQLEQIVFKLLEKNPDDRYQTARKVVDALDAMRRMRGSVVPVDTELPANAPVEAVEEYARSATVATPGPIADAGVAAAVTAAATAESETEAGARAETTQAVRGRSRRWIIAAAVVAVAAIAAFGAMKLSGGGGDGDESRVAAADKTKPETPRPETAKPESEQPATPKPEAKQPETAKPESEPPETAKPEPETKTKTKIKTKSRKPSTPKRVVRRKPHRRPTPTVTTTEPETDVAPVTRTPVIPQTTTVVPPPVTPPKTVPKPAAKPRLDARAAIQSFRVNGPLSTGRVRAAVDRVAGSFRSCYRKAARAAGRDAAGSVSVRFRIGESRRASSVQVGSAPLPGVASCIKSAVRNVRTRRAPDVGSVRVTFHVRYTPLKP